MPAANAETPAEPTKLVCFYLHGQEYAADIDQVKETLTMRPITNVFLTPDWLAGIINLRGDVVAVIDLAVLLVGQPTQRTDTSRIVVVRGDGKRAGIVVDSMTELRTLRIDRGQPPPPGIREESAGLVSDIVTLDSGKPLRILDLSQLLESDRMREFQRQP